MNYSGAQESIRRGAGIFPFSEFRSFKYMLYTQRYCAVQFREVQCFP